MTIPTERILGAPGMFVGGITGMALIELIGHLERTVGAPQVERDGDEQRRVTRARLGRCRLTFSAAGRGEG